MRPSYLAFLAICILVSFISLSDAQPTFNTDASTLVRRSEDSTSKILEKVLEKCSCYGMASLSPQLCLSNCLHTLTPAEQVEALNEFHTPQELAAYLSVIGACMHCARVVHNAYLQNRRTMRAQRDEHRLRMAQNALRAQDARAVQREYQQQQSPDDPMDEVRIDVNDDGQEEYQEYDQDTRFTAPQPMEQMRHPEASTSGSTSQEWRIEGMSSISETRTSTRRRASRQSRHT